MTTLIENEIRTSLQSLTKETIGEIDKQRAYDIAVLFGAPSDLLGTIGSWGDTLPDEEVLRLLREYNEKTQ